MLKDYIVFICPESEHGCEFKTKSERVFVAHLIDYHAFRPGQIPRVLAKIEKQNETSTKVPFDIKLACATLAP